MHQNTIIFDGECNLCNGVVGWLLKSAPANVFEYIPFKSSKGQNVLQDYDFSTKELTTLVLIDYEGAHTYSDGFLKIIAQIPRYKLVAALLAFIPRKIRDTIYNVASKNRVKWFGKSTACVINT